MNNKNDTGELCEFCEKKKAVLTHAKIVISKDNVTKAALKLCMDCYLIFLNNEEFFEKEIKKKGKEW